MIWQYQFFSCPTLLNYFHQFLRNIDAPAIIPTIFEPFTTLNPDWHPSGITKGLGLALARHLARLHKGELLAHSDGPDLGSTFTLTLPLDHLPLHGDT